MSEMIPFPQKPPISETYPFPGASTCYSRAYKLLKWMGEEGGYVTVHKKKGKPVGCSVDPEMDILVKALGKGDEETIKAYLIDPRFIDHVHA
jgi:hypothetical protein